MNLPDHPIDIEAIRDPSERSSGVFLWICAVPAILAVAFYSIITLGLVPLMLIVFGLVGELFILAHFKLNGIRVSPEQFPKLDEAADNFARRLGIPRPDVFIVQETMFNAFAAKLAGRRVIVLYSGAVDSVLRGGDEMDLAFILGHEFGHIAAGHVSFAHRLKMLGAWFIWVGLWHRRRMELTCDRVGLALVGDTRRAMRAMAHMTVGSALAPSLNVDAAFKQLREYDGEFFVRYRVFYSLYPSQLHRLENLQRSAQHLLPAEAAPQRLEAAA